MKSVPRMLLFDKENKSRRMRIGLIPTAASRSEKSQNGTFHFLGELSRFARFVQARVDGVRES